jgi:hypothetical protein
MAVSSVMHSRKNLKRIAIALAFLVALFILFPGYILALIGPPLERMHAHRALSHAKTSEELKEAVGGLGAFFPLTNGAWVAISYRDSHAGPGFSCAVAHDSGGQWFYSDVHFCGRFRSYGATERQTREFAAVLEETNGYVEHWMKLKDQDLFALATATNLVAARQSLIKLGFHP